MSWIFDAKKGCQKECTDRLTYTTSRLRRITPKNPHEITAYHAYMVCYNLLVCKMFGANNYRTCHLIDIYIYTYSYINLRIKNVLITITCYKRSSVVCLCFCRLRRRRTGIDLPLRGIAAVQQWWLWKLRQNGSKWINMYTINMMFFWICTFYKWYFVYQ